MSIKSSKSVDAGRFLVKNDAASNAAENFCLVNEPSKTVVVASGCSSNQSSIRGSAIAASTMTGFSHLVSPLESVVKT